MGTSIRVDFSDEGPDDGDFNENDTGDTSFDPESFDSVTEPIEPVTEPLPEVNAPVASADVKDFVPGVSKPVDVEALVDKEIKKLTRQSQRDRQQLIDEQRREQKRLLQDQANLIASQYSRTKSEIAERKSAAREEAITYRVQAYAASSTLGMPGYVTASAIDQLFIRPQEKQHLNELDAYKQAVESYHYQVKQDLLALRRAQEDQLRNAPVTAVDVDALRAEQGLPPISPPIDATVMPTVPPPPRKEVVADTRKSLTELGFKGTSSAKIDQLASMTNEVLGDEPKFRQQMQQTGKSDTDIYNLIDTLKHFVNRPVIDLTATQPSGFRSGGGNVPPVVPPTTPPPIQPTPPTPPNPAFGKSLNVAGSIVGGVVQTGQALSQAVAGVGQATNQAITGAFSTNPYQGISSAGKAVKQAMDPLGFIPAYQVAVTGMDTLLTLTEQIRNYAASNTSFSPLSIEATVEGEVAKLMQQIKQADRLDPLKSEVIKAATQLDLQWNELRAELFQQFAPVVIQLLQGLTTATKGVQRGVVGVSSVIENTPYIVPILGQLRMLAETIAANTQKDQKDALDSILDQIENFLDPDNVKLPNMNPFNVPNGVP